MKDEEQLLQDAVNMLAALESYVDISTISRAKGVQARWVAMKTHAKSVLDRAKQQGVQITDMPGRF